MEEADVLGDRLAALHLGKLRCHATPMFLKKAVGSGFQVKITTINEPDEPKITGVLNDRAEGAILKEKTRNTLVYSFPPGTDMPKLFRLIEAKKPFLDIKSLGIGVTTLEDVFLQLCCDVNLENAESESQLNLSTQVKYISGCRLLCRQIQELLRRQVDYTMSKKLMFVLLHIVSPFVLCTSLTQIFNVHDTEANQNLTLNLDMYSETGLSRAALSIKNTDMGRRAMTDIKYSYPFYEFTNLEDFPYVHSLKQAERVGGTTDWTSYMIGIFLNKTDAKILYVPSLKHSAPVGLNLLSNILSIQTLPRAHGKTIVTKVTNNFPLSSKSYYMPKSKINCSLFAIFNICALIAATISDLSLPCKERATVARHTHIMAGCSPALYWLVTFLYHMTCYVLFCCSATLVAAAFFDNDETLDYIDTLVAIFVVVTISGMSTYAFMYFISYFFTEGPASLILVACFLVFGFLTPITIMALKDLTPDSTDSVFSKAMDTIGYVLPVYMFAKAFVAVTDIARFNSFCVHNWNKCPKMFYYTEGFDAKICCSKGSADEGPFRYFAFDEYAAGWPSAIILAQFVCFTSLVLLLEYGIFNNLWSRMGKVCKISYPKRRYSCPKVKQERLYVDKKVDKESANDTLLVERAWKVYRSLIGRKTFALRGASFSIKKGECFGILGLNGAGKTTTFKLIAREESLTRGRIFVNGQFVRSRKYLRNLGYCPQFCGLDDFRTGKANLQTLLILRGLSDEDVKREAAAWLEVVGLTNHAHRLVSGYSGGMMRRLATIAALCGGAPLTLLDEPTAGVDTAARHLVWAAVAKGLGNDRAIAMSSHCMEEMERLCQRVTILSVGEMSVLGSPQSLKDQYAPGHTIILKLRPDVADSGSGFHLVKQLKRALERKFNCTMKDVHLTSLHYRINELMPYSEIFTKMEELVSEFEELVEDYSVSDTTLEDVFLAFANTQQQSVSNVVR